ncbi:hypothetical protein [Streptomyces sp. NPDC026092]|uniref:hypothetical protein n=1 Tax=Streptomyces sp. NPDC026092 TaxID=3154797 RepID=UPI0033D2CE1B
MGVPRLAALPSAVADDVHPTAARAVTAVTVVAGAAAGAADRTVARVVAVVVAVRPARSG